MNVIWVTGLPGSGKSTFSRNLRAFLTDEGVNAVILDGDDLREAFNHTFGYTKEDRIKVSYIYVNLAKILASQGIVVIVSTVSLFNEVFTYLETEIPTAKIVLLDANKKLLDSRNQKQLRSISAQNSPGVSLEVDYPNKPMLRLDGDEDQERLDSIHKYLLMSIT